MEFATGLASLALAFVFLYAGGLQYALNREELALVLGDWTVGRTWYQLKAVGVLAMAGGAALLLPLVADVPWAVRPCGAVLLAVITLASLADHLRRRRVARAAVDLVLADLALALAVGCVLA